MRTQSRQSQTIKTGKVLTIQLRKSIRALTNSNTPANVTVKRLQTLLSSFRVRVNKLAKSANGRSKRH